eukprot:11478376-Ditylum_brightwellii.AAC.1
MEMNELGSQASCHAMANHKALTLFQTTELKDVKDFMLSVLKPGKRTPCKKSTTPKTHSTLKKFCADNNIETSFSTDSKDNDDDNSVSSNISKLTNVTGVMGISGATDIEDEQSERDQEKDKEKDKGENEEDDSESAATKTSVSTTATGTTDITGISGITGITEIEKAATEKSNPSQDIPAVITPTKDDEK